MQRLPLVVRDATPEDAAAFIDLWRANAAAAETTHSRSTLSQLWREPDVAEAAEAIALNVTNAERRLIVALAGGEAVGVMSAHIRTLTPIHLSRAVVVSELEVRPEWRRRSVASTLLSCASDWAEAEHCDVVIAVSGLQQREPSRFLTKLGFNQLSIARGVPTNVLRSRLSAKATQSRDTGKKIAMRRALRRRQLRDAVDHDDRSHPVP